MAFDHIFISDSKFARSAFEVASQTRTPRLLISTYPYDLSRNCRSEWKHSKFECLGDLDVSCSEENRLVQSLTPPPGIILQRVMASCNGLIVLGKSRVNCYSTLCLWNPTTGFFRKIPYPKLSVKFEEGVTDVTCAFGHVMATDDYKLVFFVPMDCTVHIFSTRDGSWKVIRFPQTSFPCYDDSPLLVSNEAIHWVSAGVPEAISAFDLGSEEFRRLPLPPALIKSILYEDVRYADIVDDEYGIIAMNAYNEVHMNVRRLWTQVPRRLWTQVLVGGRLCVRSHNEYWVMKQYGVPESWVKMFQFNVVDLPNVFASVNGWDPAFVTEDGTVVMVSDMEMVRIECHREGKPLFSGRYKIKSVEKELCLREVTVYDETLLSI